MKTKREQDIKNINRKVKKNYIVVKNVAKHSGIIPSMLPTIADTLEKCLTTVTSAIKGFW
jgi:hypothetical protein